MSLCEICHKNDVKVHLKMSEVKTMHLCMECHNNLLAEEMEIHLIPFKHGVYEFTGIGAKRHQFYIDRTVSPVGICFEADELTADNSAGYRVGVMDEVDCDQQLLFEKLQSKIKKTLSKKYLKTSTHPYGGKYVSIKENEVAGRLEYDDTQVEISKVIVDGKEFTWEELGRMMNSFQGFQFKLKIYDMKEDLD